MDYLKYTLIPRVTNFSNEIDEFRKHNEDVLNCIIKFDKSISVKVNKS